MQRASPVHEPLRRQLTLLSLWLLMINGVVGAGIFGLPGEVARLAGGSGVFIFPICAVIILPIILVFVQLGGRYSGTGGPMLYTGTAFGPFAGFQTGWAFYVARLTAFAANINLLVTTLAWFWPALADPLPKIAVLAILISILAAANIHSAKGAMTWLGVLTICKFLPMLGVVGVGLFMMRKNPQVMPELAQFSTDGMGAALLLVIYAFVGFESGLVPAAEARNPQRDIPRALLMALLFAAALYAGVYFVCHSLVTDLPGNKQPVIEAGVVLFGTSAAVVLTLAVAASVAGNLLGAMFSSPRITYRLALEGQLPFRLASIDPVHGTPAVSILFFAVLCLLLAATGTFVWLASLSVVVRLLIYLGCIATVYADRAEPESAELRLQSWGGRLIAMLALLVCLYLLWQVTATAWLMTAALLGAGSILYLVARTKKPS